MKLFTILKRKPEFACLVFGQLISAIGTGLSRMIIYGELSRLKVETWYFAVTFGLEILPAVLASILAGRYSNRINLATTVILSKVAAAVSLVIPILALQFKEPYLFLLTGLIHSFLSGFNFPLY